MEEMHLVKCEGRGQELSCPLSEPLSLHLHLFTNPEALWTLSFWIFMKASYKGMIDKSLAFGDLIQAPAPLSLGYLMAFLKSPH